ncbi:L,D-transpeptidase family protein [Streptosporangium sp. CA-135522]|uniref:L,D-transpeptidase family protein n=1 Tax=Streptosporangium sp. CA-135522 TaxID=3240072 RepID=UPI003D946139
MAGLLGLPAPASAEEHAVHPDDYAKADERVVHPGDYAKAVERLQQRLQELRFSPGLVNGYYGVETQSAVWAFQESQGLTVKDEVGPETWQALEHPRRLPPLVSAGQPRRVEIDLHRELLTVYRHNRPRLISHVSTGSGPYFCQYGYSSNALTPTGNFRIVERDPHQAANPLETMYETLSFSRSRRVGDFRRGVTSGLTTGLKGAGTGVVMSLSIKDPVLPVRPVPPAASVSDAAPAGSVPAPPASSAMPVRVASGCARVPEHIAEQLFHMVTVGERVYVRRMS